MAFASGFTIFQLIPGVGDDTLLAGLGIHEDTFVLFMAWFVCLLLIGMAGIARMSLDRARQRPGIQAYMANDKLDPRTIAEVYGSAFLGLVSDILGKDDGERFFPYLAALFAYIFVSNVIGLVPGFLPPTDNMSNNIGMALLSFLVFNYVGLSRDPIGYVKHLFGPAAQMSPSKELVPFLITASIAPMIFAIEVFGLLLRVFTLSVRLTANMFGDHAVFSTMSTLAPFGVPAVFIGFGIFVSFVQAFVFTLLTTIYISLSKPHEHEHDDEHGGHDHDHDAPGHDHAHAH